MKIQVSEKLRATVLHDFQRTVRNEPAYYIYKHKIFIVKDSVPANEVIPWLRERYVDCRRGHRYRVVTYKNAAGDCFVDCILMETCKDTDLVYIKIRWGYSHTKVARGNKVVRKRLKKEQKAYLDALIKKTRDDFYRSL